MQRLWELSRHDWAGLRALVGDARSLPDAIAALASANSQQRAQTAHSHIEGLLIGDGVLYPAALPACSSLVFSLGGCTELARPHLLELLVLLSGAKADGDPALERACLAEIARGYIVYANVAESTTNQNERSDAIDLLGCSALGDGTLRQRTLFYYRALIARGAPELEELLRNWVTELESS